MAERVSIADLHQHTIYSSDIITMKLLGVKAVLDSTPLEPPDVRFRTNKRNLTEALKTNRLTGNFYVTMTDHESPEAGFVLMSKHPEWRKQIIPSYEAAVMYQDPLLGKDRKMHLNVYGLGKDDHPALAKKQDDLGAFIDACKERNLVYQLNHILWPPDYQPYSRPQLEQLFKTHDFPLVEGINGMRDPCINYTITQILGILSKQTGKKWVLTAGSDDHTYYAGTTWTAVEYAETKDEFLQNLIKGKGIRTGGEQGAPAKTLSMVWDYLYSRMNPDLREYVNDILVRYLGSLEKAHSNMYPLLAGRILQEWTAMYTQAESIRHEYGLTSIPEETKRSYPVSYPKRNVRYGQSPEIYGLETARRYDHDTVLFFTDIPVGHHSGVGMWLDEMIKYAGKNGPHIVIVNPATEHAPYGFCIKDVNSNVRVIGFRPSIKLFSSEEVTKDFPIDPTVYLGVTVSSQEHSSRAVSSLLASRENRLVKPYSLTHTQLRALIERGALGRPVAGVFIQDGPFSKLGYGECKGYLDIPKTEVFVTIIAGFATERARKLIRKQFHLPDQVMDYQPVDVFLTEALEPFRGFIWENTISFLNKCETVLAPPAMVDVLKKQGLTTNVAVFSRGVDLRLFRSGKKGDGKTIKFLYAGRLSDTDHGVFEIAKIVEGIPDLDITIAGDGPDEDEFKRRMPARTKYLGRIPHDDVAKVMSGADLVIVASTQHTHGNIYYEAIASGAVVLARDSKAAMEVVGGNKDVPFAKIYGSVEEAREFLISLQQDPKRLHVMQKAAREYASKNFKSWDFVFREQLFGNIEASRSRFKKNLTTPGILRNIWIKGMAKRKASKQRKKLLQEQD